MFKNSRNMPQITTINGGTIKNTIDFRAVAIQLFGKPHNRLPIVFQMFAYQFADMYFVVFLHKKSVNCLLIAYLTLVVPLKTVIPNKYKQFTPRGREPP